MLDALALNYPETDNFLLKQEWDVVLELVWDVHVK